MAAPAVPSSPWPGKGFYQLAIDMITILSNMSLPLSGDASATGVFSGTTAATLVNCVTAQRNLL